PCSHAALRHCAELLEQSHHVEELSELLDLAPLEGDDLRPWQIDRLARGRNGAIWPNERASMRAGPGHLDGDRVAARENGPNRSLAIGKGLLPSLVGLDHFVGSLDAPLAPHPI